MKILSAFRELHLVIFALVYVLSSASIAKCDRLLEGRKLRCCTLIERTIIYEDPTGTTRQRFSGLAIDYLTILEDRLGFRCETLKLFNASKPENRGFTGFVLQMEECTQNGTIISSPNCQCDIGVGGWVLNEERVGRVDFLPSYLTDDFRMLTHVDNINFRSASGAFFITAFSTTTWVAVFGLLVFFMFLKLFDGRFAPPDPALTNRSDEPWHALVMHYLRNSRLPERLKIAIKNTLREIIGQPIDDVQGDAQTGRQWFITYMLLFCGLFLTLAYEATMTASLVQEIAGSEFRTIKDLKICRIQGQEVCVPAGGAAFAFWESAIARSPCDQGAPPATIVNTYEEGRRKVANKQCKYFLASGATTRDAAHGRYCGQVATTGEPFFLSGAAYVLPKGSNLTKILTSETLRLRALDAIETIDSYVRRNGECEIRTSVSLTFGRLQVFFILTYSVCVLMFIVMVFCPQQRRQRQNTRHRDVSYVVM